jgi:hypothetical protein
MPLALRLGDIRIRAILATVDAGLQVIEHQEAIDGRVSFRLGSIQ